VKNAIPHARLLVPGLDARGDECEIVWVAEDSHVRSVMQARMIIGNSTVGDD